MTADQLFHTGQLDDAITLLNHELREAPTDTARRSFLVELLCLNGRWDRAARVLDGLTVEQTPGQVQDQAQTAHGIFAGLLRAEARRRAFLRGEGTPRVLGAEVPGLDLSPYQAAAQALQRREDARAWALLDEAEGRRPRVPGTRNGTPFSDVRDADDRFAPVLEALDGEDYAWLPLSAVHSLRIEAPRHPADLVFARAVVDLGQGSRRIFLCTRYPGSESASQPELRLGWQTTTLPGTGVCCLGQRVLTLDDQMVPLLQLGSLACAPQPGAVATGQE